MDFGAEAGFPGGVPDMGGAFDLWGGGGLNDQAIWATEDEYRNWNGSETPSGNFSPHPLLRSGSGVGGEPPNKKNRSSQSGDSGGSRSKAIGRMFYKTKLCCKFRAGVCPYITNCNFAHGLEELRKPPPNWQDIVAAHEEERGVTVEQREEHQIPTISTTDSRVESQRSYKGRHCKKFYTEEGCPYGDNCTFLHDEQSRSRESVAISVSPTVGGAFGANGPIQKPSNWKTRICNKWETTGSCPFGSKCHFAHGLAELHKFGGGLMEGEVRDSSLPPETKASGMATKPDTSATQSLSTPRQEFHHVGLGIPSQRSSNVTQGAGPRPAQKWKGPDKISRIYGDWIDDIE
ncbi:zinc finger CCCH domain-containing protein 56 [Beta vulgaris subsp. vulgaris]|uniref:zinc finger CCCH domain-containing protein 56 n=1 Tax=Beta vulgaris subsp. vulgaris TaxID=3555 RepID=UPI002036E230|nr:zinc finger CCCH domain-containing protein 56 [Beta vulgaris subsp. vulgaris]